MQVSSERLERRDAVVGDAGEERPGQEHEAAGPEGRKVLVRRHLPEPRLELWSLRIRGDQQLWVPGEELFIGRGSMADQASFGGHVDRARVIAQVLEGRLRAGGEW